MKLSKIFHFLYFSVLAIPLVTIPIFAIYSQNHEINDNTLQVQENKVVDFNQKFNMDYGSSIYTGFSAVDGISTDTDTNSLSVTGTSNQTALVQIYRRFGTEYNLQLNHYYVISCNLQITQAFGNYMFRLYPYTNTGYVSISSNDFVQMRYKIRANVNSVQFELGIIGNALDSSSINGNTFNINYLNIFDLTQMFGEGNEPTIEQFNSYFPNSYYPYTESEEVVIENYETITYNDTDIMSQFMYQEYNFMDKYLGMYKYQPFSGIYSWLINTFFGGSAPLVFTIFYQWFSYWLFVSLCWMVFDVLIYIPMVAHRWLDKGALE